MTASRGAYWALAVIFIANFFNYLDRQLVSALEKPISEELLLSQFEFGLLWTLFTVGYMVCAVPIGLVADRYSRTRLFAICIVVWSLATIVSGMATDKIVLFAARILIGVGEAGCLIIGPALISDLFPKEVRGKMLSFFYLAMPLGGALAFVLAGVFLDIGWRMLFAVAGYPGFLIALLIWTMRDPPRGGSEGSHHAHGGGSWSDYKRLLRTPTLILIIFAQAFAMVLLVNLIHFGARFFEEPPRSMDPKVAKESLGVMALIGGAGGILVSGWLGDRLSRRWVGAYALLAGVSYLLALPCVLVGVSITSSYVFLPALTLGAFFLFLCMPAVNTQIANVSPPALRATAWALAVFILHLFGDTVAPPVFGLVSGEIGRQDAFMFFSAGLGLASLCCFIAAWTAKRDTARLATFEHPEPPTGASPAA